MGRAAFDAELQALDAKQQLDEEYAKRQEELAALMTREQGKPLKASRNEVAYAADFLAWFAEEAKRAYDAGASCVHIHARNDDGSYDNSLEAFQAIVCMDDSERLTAIADHARTHDEPRTALWPPAQMADAPPGHRLTNPYPKTTERRNP